MKRYEANEIRNMIIDECAKHEFCSSCPFYDKNDLICSLNDSPVGLWERDGLYRRKPKDGLKEEGQKIRNMSDDTLAQMLVDVGSHNLRFPCMTETRIWRIAKKFNMAVKGYVMENTREALEMLMRAIEACKEGDGK